MLRRMGGSMGRWGRRSASGSPPPPVTGMAMGQNVDNLVYYQYDHPTVDILHGDTIKVIGGTFDGQPVPDANRDSLGNPNSLPSGATGFSIGFQTPEVSEAYILRWSVGGSGTGTPTIQTHGGFSGGFGAIVGSTLTATPDSMAAGSVVNFIHYTLPGDGSWPVWTSFRPVADPGGTFSASFLAKLGALSSSSIRFLKWASTEYNGGPTNGSTLKFPQDGDGQLAQKLITGANRNTLSSADWWQRRDNVPVELCIAAATALGRDIFYSVPNQTDGWNADGSPGTPTYYPAIAALFAAFSQSTGHKCAFELGNENWGGENDGLVNQFINEANYRGQGSDCHTACVCVATSNITLSGTQTIDGVAVTAGQRVLVAGQATASQNGPYVCAAGAWSRAADTIASADKWFISGGTSHGTQTWYCTNTGTITLGTTALTIVQFDRGARQAEKSAQMFGYFETAFNALGVGPANGANNKLIRVYGWQNAGSQSAVQLALNNPVFQGHVDALCVAPYYDPVGDAGIPVTYNGDFATYEAACKTAVDVTLGRLVTWATFCATNGLQLILYEMGPSAGLTNSTFIASWATAINNHDVVCYYLNEIRRRVPTLEAMHWLDFLDGTDGTLPTSSEDWGLIHKITDDPTDVTQHPKAKAVIEAIAGQYTMFDPTATNNGAGFGSPSGTAAVSFPGNGLLPEATFSINDPSGKFVLSAGFSAAAGGSINTVGTGIAAGTYNVDFKQTYNGTTHTTTYGIVVAAAATLNLNFATPAYTVNGTSYGSTLSSIPGYSYARANALTVTDSTGTITTFTANTVPITNVLHSYVGLSNLLSNPQDFSNASWNKANVTVTANTTVAPDGTTTADTANTTVINASTLWESAGQTQGNPYTFSWYALRGTATGLNYALRDGIHGVDIVASTSYYSQTNGSTFSRIIAPYTAGSSGTGCYVLRDSPATGTCFLWQAQCVPGNFPDGGPLVTTATSTPTLSFTFPNGTYSVTYTFDDNSTQVVSKTVSGNTFTVDTAPTLNRGRIKSIVC